MKKSADLGGCYPPRPSASVDNTLVDLRNSSYPTRPHSIIATVSILRHLQQVYYELATWPAPRWLDSSVGRAMHRCRRGHGIESFVKPESVFSGFNFTTTSVMYIAAMINHVFIKTGRSKEAFIELPINSYCRIIGFSICIRCLNLMNCLHFWLGIGRLISKTCNV